MGNQTRKKTLRFGEIRPRFSKFGGTFDLPDDFCHKIALGPRIVDGFGNFFDRA